MQKKDLANLSFIKFTNYSFFGQCLQKYFNFSNTDFIDDGTVFINLIDDSIEYTNPFKKAIKLLLWPRGYNPKFNEFKNVKNAYIAYLDIIPKDKLTTSTSFNDIGILFSYERLEVICKKYFSYEGEITKWRGYLKKHSRLILGSSLVEHGFIDSSKYFKILSEASSKKVSLYKPHPTENSNVELQDMWFLKPIDLPNIPIEMFLVNEFPDHIISFACTTSFWLKYSNISLKNDIYMIEPLFSPEIKKSLCQLKDKCFSLHHLK